MKRFVAIDTRETTVFDVVVAKDLITAVRQMYERVYPQYDPRDLSFRQVGQFAWSEHAHMLDVYLIPADLQDVYRGRCDDDIITSIERYDGMFISRVKCETKKNADLESAIKNARGGFTLATEAAALTHGHPAGSLSAGHFAVMIAALLRGESFSQALDGANSELRRHSGHDEVTRAIDAARMLAARGRPSPEQLESLGAGWVAEEAISIAICCALVAKDFRDGVLLAVNHSGDSDSTGSLAGNLLGAQMGIGSIPPSWLERLELRDVIERLAIDLNAIASGTLALPQAWDAYPGH